MVQMTNGSKAIMPVKKRNLSAITKTGPTSKRPRHSPPPSNDYDQKASMLAALQAHSMTLLGMAPSVTTAQAGESSTMAQRRAMSDLGEDSQEEEDEEGVSDDGWGAGDGMVSDSEDEFGEGSGIASGKPSKVPEVVFDQSIGRSSDVLSKSERRAFLTGNSAKIMSLPTSDPSISRKRPLAKDNEEETNSALDKTLHTMLLSNLLPSHSLSSASRPVEKRDAVENRLRQLAGYDLPGESSSSSSGVDKGHSARIKTGINKAAERRSEKERKESEMAGSWVRGKGGLGDLGKRGEGIGGMNRKEERMGVGQEKKKKGMQKGDERRQRGLRESGGVGKFDGGVLRVSEREIGRVERMTGVGGRGRGGGGRGRGGGRGGRGRGGGKR